ncbi:MAG TPA: CPBP family intramembrane glutamic endopeptidase [Bryobacteraceae bacterium]|nr:CPBP family intramembrane glutamic endopeptidase [Bryobacteraceae bacterium]
MKPMLGGLRGFALAVAGLWIVLGIAAWPYSQDQNIPRWILLAVLPAFLIEAALYLAAGLESTRRHLEQLPAPRLALLMTLSAPLPLAIYMLSTGVWDSWSFAAVLGLAMAASWWFILLPRNAAVDIGFLALLAAPIIADLFKRIYPAPTPKIAVQILGVSMWVRTGMLAILSIRRMEGIGFGFVPRAREWLIGVRYFAYFLPIGAALAAGLAFIRPEAPSLSLRTVVLTIATFAGVLWVLALSEEFFFRGILQQQLSRWLRSEWAGLICASILFGLVHLWFRAFPNWRFALLATVAGVFYGLAYMRGRSIRPAMVTHALVVTTWKLIS